MTPSPDHSLEGRAIGWIGVGIMGSRMASRLLDQGASLTVYARRPETAKSLVERGVALVATPAEVAAASAVTFTMLSMPADVEDVYFGPVGLIERSSPGSLLVDMTTSRPDLARRISKAAVVRGAQALDAPVSGGPAGAEAGTLSIMVGGPTEALDQILPLLRQLGSTVVRHGSAGAGQTAKLVNQVAVGGAMLGICEAFALASRTGLQPEAVLETIGSGIAASNLLRFMWPRLTVADGAPGFRIEHMVKDLGLALELVEGAPIKLRGTALAQSLYQVLIDEGFANEGTQALEAAIDPAWRTRANNKLALDPA